MLKNQAYYAHNYNAHQLTVLLHQYKLTALLEYYHLIVHIVHAHSRSS